MSAIRKLCIPVSGYTVGPAVQRDFSELLDCYKNKQEELAVSKWDEIRTRSEKYYVDKLLLLAIKNLCWNVSNAMYNAPKRLNEILFTDSHWSPRHFSLGNWNLSASTKALKECDDDISVVLLIAKHADLSAVDDLGYKPVDHLLQELMGNAIYDFHENSIKYVAHSCSDLEDDRILALLSSLMDKKILDSPYQWGYSYFGVMVLVGWWKVVTWGLDSGADVSDNGVCPHLPIEAAFAKRISAHLPNIPGNIFARLLDSTTIDRQIFPGQASSNGMILPLQKVCHNVFQSYLIPYLVKAGARIDRDLHLDRLPMEIYAKSAVLNLDPQLFHHLVPSSEGLSPKVFLELVHRWQRVNPHQQDAIKSILCQHLKFSPGWHEMRLFEAHPHEKYYTPGFLHLAINKQIMSKHCVCGIARLIDALMKLGLRARIIHRFMYVSPSVTALNPGVNGRSHMARLIDVKKKWINYIHFLPSLMFLCVWVIRSALPTVTDQNVAKLPLPASLRKLISMKTGMKKMLESVKFCREPLGS